jgi:SAM-dependent methyltransferase
MDVQNDELDDPLVPPPHLLAEPAAFKPVGEGFKRLFIELGGLRPDDAVLDVGCGTGRMALPLTGYLSKTARYEGFDAHAERVRWCQDNISPRFPNFRFHFSDVRNGLYNPAGKYPAVEYRFPFEDREFDFVYLTSVFTHMLPRDLQHYLSEIARVMKKGGKCLITYFLLNPEAESLIASGRGRFTFRFEQDQARTEKLEPPEQVVAYEESFLQEVHGRHTLPIRSIHYGKWCGRKEFLRFQDIIICERE